MFCIRYMGKVSRETFYNWINGKKGK